ncbi:MAG TPA: hypothetical protein PLQ00_01390, partial [Thermoguttaceae bacterium]|nr:hypothetical protein [Thermoguttaceae bacterium]
MHEQRKFFNFSGITWRFAGYSSALLIGFCLVITQTTSRWQEEEIRARLEEKGQVLVSVLVRTCADFLDTLNIKQLRLAAWDVSSYPEVMYIYIFDAQGRILTDGTSTNRFRNMVLADPMTQKAVQTTSMYLQYAPHLLEVCSPVYLGEKKVGGVRIGLSTRHIEQEIAALRKRNFSIGALFVLTGIGISWL